MTQFVWMAGISLLAACVAAGLVWWLSAFFQKVRPGTNTSEPAASAPQEPGTGDAVQKANVEKV